jgi:hypothetical protein
MAPEFQNLTFLIIQITQIAGGTPSIHKNRFHREALNEEVPCGAIHIYDRVGRSLFL